MNNEQAVEVIRNNYPPEYTIFSKALDLAVNTLQGINGTTSDGYHTFDELYYHRMMLFAVICKQNKDKAWKSWKHHDGSMFDDYFIVGITTAEGDFTYHYHKDYWDLFDVKELEFANVWDGHRPKDITRLLSII